MAEPPSTSEWTAEQIELSSYLQRQYEEQRRREHPTKSRWTAEQIQLERNYRRWYAEESASRDLPKMATQLRDAADAAACLAAEIGASLNGKWPDELANLILPEADAVASSTQPTFPGLPGMLEPLYSLCRRQVETMRKVAKTLFPPFSLDDTGRAAPAERRYFSQRSRDSFLLISLCTQTRPIRALLKAATPSPSEPPAKEADKDRARPPRTLNIAAYDLARLSAAQLMDLAVALRSAAHDAEGLHRHYLDTSRRRRRQAAGTTSRRGNLPEIATARLIDGARKVGLSYVRLVQLLVDRRFFPPKRQETLVELFKKRFSRRPAAS